MPSPANLPGFYVWASELSWAASARRNVDMSFLHGYEGYDIDHLLFQVTPDYDGGAGAGTFGEDAHRLFTQILIQDCQGPDLKLTGGALRGANFAEHGAGFADPDDTGVGVDCEQIHFFRVDFGVDPGVKSRRDTRKPVEAMKAISFLLAPAAMTATVNVVAATIRVGAYVTPRRNRLPEAPARIEWEEHDVLQQEAHYPVNGDLRFAFLINPGAAGDATGNNALDAGLTFDSTTLGYDTLPKELFEDIYRRCQKARVGETIDPFTNLDAIMLFMPDKENILGHLPSVKSLHLKMSAAPDAGTKLVICKVTDVGADYAEKATGIDASAWERVRDAQGRIATRDGRRASLKQVEGTKRRRVPVRIGPRS